MKNLIKFIKKDCSWENIKEEIVMFGPITLFTLSLATIILLLIEIANKFGAYNFILLVFKYILFTILCAAGVAIIIGLSYIIFMFYKYEFVIYDKKYHKYFDKYHLDIVFFPLYIPITIFKCLFKFKHLKTKCPNCGNEAFYYNYNYCTLSYKCDKCKSSFELNARYNKIYFIDFKINDTEYSIYESMKIAKAITINSNDYNDSHFNNLQFSSFEDAVKYAKKYEDNKIFL